MANTDTVFRIVVDSKGAVKATEELTVSEAKLKKGVKDASDEIIRATEKYEKLAKAHSQGTIKNNELALSVSKLESRLRDAGVSYARINEIATKASQNIQKSSQVTVEASGGFSKLQANIITASQAVNLLQAGFSTLRPLISKVFDSLGDAQKIEGLTASFNNLQASVGQLGSKSLEGLNRATQGLVANLDLMQSANQAVLLGVDKGTGDFEKMAAAAVKLGQATGRTAVEALNDLTVGVGRQSKLILDNLGVLVDAEKAQEKYAKANNLTTDSLTDQQKALAFQQEAFAQITEKANKLTDVQDTAGKATTALSVAFENQKNKAVETFSANKDLAKAINDLAVTFSNINFSPILTGLANIATGAFEATTKLITLGEKLYQVFDKTLSMTSEERMADIIKNVDLQLGRGLKATPITSELDKFAASLQSTAVSTEQLSSEWVKAKEKLDKGEVSTKGVGKASKDLNRELARQKELYEKLNSADGIIGATNKIESLAKEYFDGTIQANEFAKAVGKINTELAKAGVSKSRIDEIGVLGTKRGSESVFGKPKESNKNNGILGSIFGGSLLGGDLGVGGLSEEIKSKGIGTAIGEQIGSNLADGLLSSLETALSGGSFKGVLTNIGETAGASVGQVLGGPIGSAIGKVAVGKLVDSITNIGRNKALSIKGISSIATGGLTSFIPDSVFEGMFGDSAATKARKAADKFFANLFEEESLAVIINGKLSRVNDLVFSGNQEGGLFSTLSSDVQNKFSAVGSALEESLGLGEIAAVNLSNVLANNLGGDLNNLQLLIQATGKSFEELGNIAFEAFYKGEVSVTELVNQLSALHDVMSRGIPNATGAVGTAFDNVFSAGFNGGRALLDAISDIAFEAQELGVKDFPALQNVLINTFGKGTDQVVAFFQAMKVAGVNSLADLASASQATIAVIGANLEAISKGQQAVFNASSVQTPTTPDFPTFSAPKVGGFSGGGGSRSGGGSASRSKPADKFKELSLVVANLSTVAVRGVDDAIKDILALDDSAIGKLEQGFFKKFKGDMLEFEAVALSLGHSFKDLEGSIVNSFKKGATSVSEAKTALDKLYDGVEGQGNVKGAFDKILSLGTNGGQFSIEAIKALGIEADQAGITALVGEKRDKLIKERVGQLLTGRNVTSELQRQAEEQASKEIDAKFNPLKQLEEALVGSGVNGVSAKKLVEQLGQLGLDTIDEIKNVSDETAIRLLGNLDTVNIGFEKTNESIRKTQEEINKINASKEISIKVNITKGSIDSELTKELKQYGITTKELLAYIKKNTNAKTIFGDEVSRR